MFENGMDCRVLHAVNLSTYQFIDWISVSLITDKQDVKSVSCSMVVWEHYYPINDVSTVLSPVDDRLLLIKFNTNMYQNSCLLDYMPMKLIFGSTLPPVDTNLMTTYFDLVIRK